MSAQIEIVALSNAVTRRDEKIKSLEDAARDLVDLITDTISNSEGRWPQPDPGCIDCTSGTVPNRLNTGPCALHAAKRLLGML